MIAAKNAFQNGNDMTTENFIEEGFKHPMFPFTEKHSIFDEYGETVNMHELLFETANQASMEHKKSQKMDKMDIDKLEEIEEAEEEAPVDKSIPTKCIKYNTTISIKAVIQNVDFQGQADGRAIKTILQNDVTPRKLILISGSDAAKDHLIKHCEKTLKHICKLVLAPKNNELIDVASDTNIYKVKLKDTIADGLQFYNAEGYQITYVNGQIQYPKIEEGQTGAPLLSEISTGGFTPGHKAVYIGDVKLNDFKMILQQAGFRAEFYGGALIVGEGNIALRKEEVEGSSGIKIEGVISEDYFKIRQLLYSQYIVL